jgi:hypothetical protein
MFVPSWGRMPWFASALSMGHAERESVALGGVYAGQWPAWPGAPAGTTALGGLAGRRRLRRKIWKSQVRTKRSTKGLVSFAVRDIVGGEERVEGLEGSKS